MKGGSSPRPSRIMATKGRGPRRRGGGPTDRPPSQKPFAKSRAPGSTQLGRDRGPPLARGACARVAVVTARRKGAESRARASPAPAEAAAGAGRGSWAVASWSDSGWPPRTLLLGAGGAPERRPGSRSRLEVSAPRSPPRVAVWTRVAPPGLRPGERRRGLRSAGRHLLWGSSGARLRACASVCERVCARLAGRWRRRGAGGTAGDAPREPAAPAGAVWRPCRLQPGGPVTGSEGGGEPGSAADTQNQDALSLGGEFLRALLDVSRRAFSDAALADCFRVGWSRENVRLSPTSWIAFLRPVESLSLNSV